MPLSSIRRVLLDTDLFLIESDVETLSLQLVVANKSFPAQSRLIEEIAARFNVPQSIDSIRAAQARKRWLKVGIVVIGVLGALIWLLLTGNK